MDTGYEGEAEMSASITKSQPWRTNRWAQLIIAIVCMILIANYQYRMDAVRPSDGRGP